MTTRTAILLFSLLCPALGDPAAPVLKGKVESVDGTTVRIRLDADASPRKGDSVEIADEVPGIGLVPLDGTWQVARVEGRVVIAEPVGEPAAKPRAGYVVTIPTKPPKPVDGPPRVPPPPDRKHEPREDHPPEKDLTDPAPQARAAWLGVRIGQMTRDAAADLGIADGRGCLVVGVHEGGPAATAGLGPEDVVRAIGGQAAADPQALAALVQRMDPGQRVSLQVVRLGRARETLVTLGEDPEHVGAPVPSLVEYGRAWIGMVPTELSAAQARRLGLRPGSYSAVRSLAPRGPAGRAGLRPGDVLLAWNGAPVAGVGDVFRIMDRCRPGERIALRVFRSGRQGQVTLIAQPQPEVNGGRLCVPTALREWGLTVRELNRATAAAIGAPTTRGLRVERIRPRVGLDPRSARALTGAVIRRLNGLPAWSARSFATTFAADRAVRVLWTKGKQGGAFMLSRED